MDNPDPQNDQIQKLIRKITRLAAVGFLVSGLFILVMGHNIILGAILALIGLTDLVFIPRILETIIMAQFKHRNDKG
ncbi:MAG TPA: hypothetical protein DCM27_02160 [Rhodospirillaceae bacterium]|nr:hypothetical protein [Rhodospirillaceae bacterium]